MYNITRDADVGNVIAHQSYEHDVQPEPEPEQEAE